MSSKRALIVIDLQNDYFPGGRFPLWNADETLAGLGISELLLCGMMTQNCVTHTALSKAAEKHAVSVLADCCTTVSQILHLIAPNALSTRVALPKADAAL